MHFLNFGVGTQSEVVFNFYHLYSLYHDIFQINFIFADVISAVNVVHLFMFRTFKLNLGYIYSYFAAAHGILCLTSTRDALSTEASEPQPRH